MSRKENGVHMTLEEGRESRSAFYKCTTWTTEPAKLEGMTLLKGEVEGWLFLIMGNGEKCAAKVCMTKQTDEKGCFPAWTADQEMARNMYNYVLSKLPN